MLSDSTIDSIEQFLCEMYEIKEVDSVNECQFASFLKVYKPKAKHPIASVKGIDESHFTPCKSVFIEQIQRANAICSFCLLFVHEL